MRHSAMEVDHLAVGLTRPAMFFGVSQRLFFITFLAFFVLWLVTNYFLMCLTLFVVLMGIFQRISIHEPNFYTVWFVALSKTPPVLNSHFWGRTNSYEPW